MRFGVSNPAPRYVESVATAFKEGIFTYTKSSGETITYGSGEFGDMSAFNIIPCSLLINCFRKEQPEPGTVGKVSWVYMFIMWFSGLRGGVAFAIAATNYADNEFPENDESLAILQTTLWVATFTIFVFGGLITNIAIYFDVLDKPGDAAKEVEMTTSLSESRKNQFKAMDSFYDMDRSMKKYTSFSAQGRLEGSHAHSRLEEE